MDTQVKNKTKVRKGEKFSQNLFFIFLFRMTQFAKKSKKNFFENFDFFFDFNFDDFAFDKFLFSIDTKVGDVS